MKTYDDFYIEALAEPMKYVKHDVDAHTDTALLDLVIEHGMAAYGMYWLLVESLTGRAPHVYDLSKRADDRALMRDLSFMCDISASEVKVFLGDLAARGLIDTDMWQEGKVIINRIARDADNYAKGVASKKLGAYKTNQAKQDAKRER